MRSRFLQYRHTTRKYVIKRAAEHAVTQLANAARLGWSVCYADADWFGPHRQAATASSRGLTSGTNSGKRRRVNVHSTDFVVFAYLQWKLRRKDNKLLAIPRILNRK